MENIGPGTVIGGVYHVVRQLGEGAMGVVLLAHDESLERSVAIKLIRPELLGSSDLHERFVTEARALARVNHPHVLRIYAYGDHGDSPYFVTELVEGETVEDMRLRLPPGEVMEPALALSILDQTCQGVSAIHAASTVHRDLKPSNLLIDRDMRVRVADLGVANLVHVRRGPESIVGTPAYMSPEIALESDVSPLVMHRADVYSLGCIAFELLTGRLPFLARGALALMTMQATEPPPVPSSINPRLPPAFDEVLLRALAKNPEERTPSADALRRELLAAHQGASDPVRILLAEDDDDFREALAITLSHEFPDAEIEAFPDGAMALEAFDAKPHSVAILDIAMPNLDGIELTAILRTRPSAHRVPIIVLTAQGGPGEWKRLSALGADGFLVKPVRLPDVVALVRRALKDRTSLPGPAPRA